MRAQINLRQRQLGAILIVVGIAFLSIPLYEWVNELYGPFPLKSLWGHSIPQTSANNSPVTPPNLVIVAFNEDIVYTSRTIPPSVKTISINNIQDYHPNAIVLSREFLLSAHQDHQLRTDLVNLVENQVVIIAKDVTVRELVEALNIDDPGGTSIVGGSYLYSHIIGFTNGKYSTGGVENNDYTQTLEGENRAIIAVATNELELVREFASSQSK
jgi:hypothetical protein